MNTSTEFAVYLAREILEDLGGDPHTMPKYDADQTTALNTLLKQRCDEAGVELKDVMGIAAQALMKHSPAKAERLRRMSLQAGHAEAHSARMAAIADQLH